MTLTEAPSKTVEWYTPQDAIDFVLDARMRVLRP